MAEDDVGEIDYQSSPERPGTPPLRGAVLGPVLDVRRQGEGYTPVFLGERENDPRLRIIAYLRLADMLLFHNLDEVTMFYLNPVIDELGHDSNAALILYQIYLDYFDRRRRFFTIGLNNRDLMVGINRILVILPEGDGGEAQI